MFFLVGEFYADIYKNQTWFSLGFHGFATQAIPVDVIQIGDQAQCCQMLLFHQQVNVGQIIQSHSLDLLDHWMIRVPLSLQVFLEIRPEQVQSPVWIFNFDASSASSWRLCPSRLVPPSTIPLLVRQRAHGHLVFSTSRCERAPNPCCSEVRPHFPHVAVQKDDFELGA